MDNDAVAAVLEEIGMLLEVQGENAFRCRAYLNGAQAVRELAEDVRAVAARDGLAEVPGIGPALAQKIKTLVSTGHLPFHEELRRKTPAGLLQLLRIPGLGPKKIRALFDTLGVSDVASLAAACRDGRVAALKGFGPKTQQKILEGVDFLQRAGQRLRLDQADEIVAGLLAELRGCPGVARMDVAGSVRRRCETVNNINVVVSSADAPLCVDCLVKFRGVTEVLARSASAVRVTVDRGRFGGRPLSVPVDVRVVADEQYPFALHYFTGNRGHNTAVRERAQALGSQLTEHELVGPKGPVRCATEVDLYRALDLQFIPPELREGSGEIEVAADRHLPRLVEASDLKGTFHCHTDWSDGSSTLEEMVKAAQERGLGYLGIADHSQSLSIARGLDPARVRQQQAEIDRLSSRFQGIRIFKGTECDILGDGSLDFDDSTLATFDYVVASVHSLFKQPGAEMTARIVRAVSHPRVTMLGHATGRILLRREGYNVDLETVLRAAAEHGTAMEINANPRRLDLDWLHCKRAKELGVRLVINPDAHHTDELDNLRYGVDVARRGWLEKEDILNTRSAEHVALLLSKKRRER